ncbi:MAG: DUF2326 domain-containing protein [Lachnospiraceae bacterium]|nr:DUF2326 domain-containing protein [Lachnospiraceae bacterium]
MKLLSLRANQPSFHPVVFKNGINIIVGKQVAPHNENDGNTYNGVGKSLTLHLIHFCLGANKIDSFTQKLPGWEFTLKFEVNGREYYSSRKTDDQNKIDFCGELLTVTALRSQLLDLCFGLTNPPKYMTWNTLFSRFARRYRTCYSYFDSFVPKEGEYSKILNNCYLLGIDTDLIISKRELRDKQTAAGTTEKAIKKDPLFRQYYLGRHDAELDVADLEYRIRELEKEISAFKVSDNYHELEKEADDKSYQKKVLENRRVLVSSYIKNIDEAFKETTEAKEEKMLKIYEAANVEIPDMIKNSIDDVLQFHNNLIASRNARLRRELNKQKAELKSIDEQILDLGQRMDELLNYLNSHGALEEYTALTKQLSSLQNDLNRIQEYQKILKAYRDTELDIKASLIAEDKETDEYLAQESKYLSGLREKYVYYAKKFYPKKISGLVIRNNSGENMLRYTLEARIEDDSSDGVNEVRMFCSDLLLLLCRKSNMQFIFHDSRLFANMDPRQREMLFRIVNEACQQDDFQYICSINEDSLLSVQTLMTQDEFEQNITDNIILELKDDAPERKLLGIQVDIDLEDKSKASEEIG